MEPEHKTNFEQFLYAAIGSQLVWFAPDLKACQLVRMGSKDFASNIQYIWPSDNGTTIYLALSDGGPGITGSQHHLLACSIDRSSGSIHEMGAYKTVPFRPIHLCLDKIGSHILTAYNNPSALTAHKINEDGSIGSETTRKDDKEVGIFGHQIMISPDGKTALLVCRGYDADDTNDERPGSLEIFSYGNGLLHHEKSIKPGKGYGFGARHLDFHRNAKWLYLAVERQSELCTFGIHKGKVSDTPLHRTTTLSQQMKAGIRQAASAVHLSPSGKFVYVSNRTYRSSEDLSEKTVPAGEDNIAVFKIDENSGNPTPIQHANTEGSLPRTFSIHKSGKMLVAANSEATTKINTSGTPKDLPLSLIVFEIQTNGKLQKKQKIEFSQTNKLLFWSGFL